MKINVNSFFSLFLIALILFITWGDYLFFKTLQNIAYFKARNIIESSHEEHLTEIHIPVEDFLTGKVSFIKEDEIIYQGNWYDIKRATIKGDVVVLVAYEDEEEKVLVENWLRRFAGHDKTLKTIILTSFQMKIFYLQWPEVHIISFTQDKQETIRDDGIHDNILVLDLFKPPETS